LGNNKLRTKQFFDLVDTIVRQKINRTKQDFIDFHGHNGFPVWVVDSWTAVVCSTLTTGAVGLMLRHSDSETLNIYRKTCKR